MNMQHRRGLLPAVSTLLSVPTRDSHLHFSQSSVSTAHGNIVEVPLGGMVMRVVEEWRPLQGNHGPLLGGFVGYPDGR